MIDMTALVAFTEARLAEDKAAALSAAAEHDDLTAEPRPNWYVQQWAHPDETAVVADSESSAWPVARLKDRPDGAPSERAAHIALHDPARTLREVEATQAMLAEYHRAAESLRLYPNAVNAASLLIAQTMLQHAASTWSDHSSYEESWKP
jgi:hypothetical protein